MNSSKRFRQLVLYVIMPVILICAGYFALKDNQKDNLPIYYKSPHFELTDAKGEIFSSESLKGQVWIADFIFTTCQGPCPIMSKNMASLHRSYLLEEDVRMVSFTVNPEYDSPPVLDKYAKHYGADQKKWHFLTGDRNVLTKIITEGFKIGSIEEPIFHSTRFVLVGKRGHIRGFYDGTDNKEIKRLFKDIAWAQRG